MELRHIRYFLTVAEEGSFTKAADRLMIAQPPLSRQIRDLEEELGTPLFVRKNHGVSLTDAGVRFRQYANQIAVLSDRSIEDIRDLSGGLHGILYLAAVEAKAPQLLSKWISSFSKENPNVEYNLWNGNTDDVVHRVMNGLSEIAVITSPFDQEDLEGLEVYREPWVAMIPKGHALAEDAGNSLKLKELKDQPLIIPSRASRLREIEDWFSPLHIQPTIICRIAHMQNAIELTKEGVGISIFPASGADYTDGSVITRPLTQPDVYATYVLIRSRQHELSKLAEGFWNMIADGI
ncbi:MAG: LysR family transcriptional regulator [Lachnospiraceae bacterium]|nr:LysR family transcriptional regulator [Lachnospiraceae bacterium]